MGGKRGSFTEMSCGRCWTMTETKERFEHCTSKNPLPFQFCVSPVSSTTESFFLSLLPLLIAACRISCSFFSSPLCSPCLPPLLPMSLSVSLFAFLRFNVVLLKPPYPTPHFLCSNSLCSISHVLRPSLFGVPL